MSEKVNWNWPKDSAEQRVKIDSEDGLMRAYKFASDPVAYLGDLRTHLLDENFEEEALAITAMGEVFELEVILGNENIPVVNKQLSAVTTEEIGSAAWACGLFSLLKEAGYGKNEVAAYIALDDPDFTPEERLRERGLSVYLNEVYGSD